MTQEEMERAVNFIVEQQAQFAAGVRQLKEVQSEFQRQLGEHQKQLGQLTQATLGLTTLVSQVATAQIRTDQKVGQLSETVAQLSQKMAETDERLNIFINVVERYISSSNGKAGS